MKELSETYRRILRALQDDLPLVEDPFAQIARKCGTDEQEVLRVVERYRSLGVIRRFGASLRHHQAGFAVNGMSVWRVPTERMEEVGNIMAAFAQVSHCYERPSFPGFDYNLFAMIHGRSREEVEGVVADIARATGIKDYEVLYTVSELNKTTMKYFAEEE